MTLIHFLLLRCHVLLHELASLQMDMATLANNQTMLELFYVLSERELELCFANGEIDKEV
jgi:hypothetical protein